MTRLCVLLGAWLAGTRLHGAPLDAAIEGLRRQLGLDEASVGVVILGDRGEILAALNPDAPLKPASNQKVLTAAAALHELGADFKYETRLVASTRVAGGLLAGDLIVQGGGDPNISGRFFDGDPGALLKRWARDLRASGLQEITGSVVADETLFDEERFPRVWDARQAEVWYCAQISALSINDNCADVTVRPGSRVGGAAQVTLVPAAPALSLEGRVETTAGSAARVIVHRQPGTNRIRVEGRIGVRAAPWRGNVTVDDPALVFAGALQRELEAAGIAVRGRPRKLERARTTEAAGRPVPAALGPESQTLLEHSSTLLQDLPIILKRSQNLHAELLFKLLGALRGRAGSREGGERAVRRFLEARGLPGRGLVLSDGSGLAHENRLTARLIALTLHSVRSEPYFRAFCQSLPLAGVDGTLDERFRPPNAARGHLYAKTGYIRGVSCLSGFVLREGRVASFAILVNGLRGGARAAKSFQERVGELIYTRL